MFTELRYEAHTFFRAKDLLVVRLYIYKNPKKITAKNLYGKKLPFCNVDTLNTCLLTWYIDDFCRNFN